MYSFNQNKILSLYIKDFTYYSLFQLIICTLLIFFHVFILYFYSSDYRKKKCDQELFKIKYACKEEIKKNILNTLRHDLSPTFDNKISLSNDFFDIKSMAKLEKMNFQLSHANIGSIASKIYNYSIEYTYHTNDYCKKFYSVNNHSTETINIKQIPLNQWLIYNANKKKLHFPREISRTYSGRIFSESDIIFNHKSVYNTNSYYSFQNTDPYTLFINYDPQGNWVGNSISTTGIIDVEIHKDYNNLIYIKKMEEYQDFNNIFKLDPIRMLTGIKNSNSLEKFKNLVHINVNNSDINTSYFNLDYIKWLQKVKTNIKKSNSLKYKNLNKNNILFLKISHKKKFDFLFINDMKTITRETNHDVKWLQFNKKNLSLDLSFFYLWYKDKANLHIPLIEESIHGNKSLMFFIELDNNFFKNSPPYIILNNSENIPYRTFLHLNSPVFFSTSVNLNENKISIMAPDFGLQKNPNLDKFIINAILYKRISNPILKDFFKFDSPGEKIDFNGSVIFLPKIDRTSRTIDDKKYLNNDLDISYTWDKNLLDEIYWMDFTPSKYYFNE